MTENQFKIILEQSKEPSMPVIVKLFKILNEEKKNHKTRAALIEVIKKFAPYMNIPEVYSLYLLELYLLNYRKDGDYSSLTKKNFIDPRKERGKWTSNPNAKLYTVAQLPFKGSNMIGEWSKDWNGKPYYKVVSYGWYPIYIFKDDTWYEASQTHSSSTSRQMSNASPVKWDDYLKDEVYTLTQDEIKMLERGKSHEEIMKFKLEKLKSLESDLSKRKKTTKTHSWHSYDDHEVPSTNIKFNVNSINVEGDKAIITIDVYDVIKRKRNIGIPTPENYLKGELGNLTPKIVEDRIKQYMRNILRDYIGTRFRWAEYEVPPHTKVEFKFNHLKQ